MPIFRRNLTTQLRTWKSKPNRLPLILWGARQVGKSTTVEAFGKAHFPRIHAFNFQKTASLKTAFSGDLQPSSILQSLALLGNAPISEADLVFFDEIQECPQALTSLKYFAENAPSQAVIAAGSHLGIISNESAFPVGKTEFMSLHPMTYFEFLENLDPATHAHLSREPWFSDKPITELYHQRALQWLRTYLCTGGMPAAVSAYADNIARETEAAKAARDVQNRLVEGYHGDFSKHSGTVNANHILRVFDAAALQLGRSLDESVAKFKFSGIIPNRKGFESIDGPLTWLEKARLVIKTHTASRFEQPIKAFTQSNYFKVYLLDVGILNAMLATPVEALLLDGLGSYKGYLAENFVAQEFFAALDQPLTGWSEGESEVEFVVSRGANLCPIEVKASSRTRRAKSLDTLINRYHPALALKVTGQNRGYVPEKKLLTLPLYLAGRVLSDEE